MKFSLLALLLLLISSYQFAFANQIDNLNKLQRSRRSANPPRADVWDDLDVDADETFSPVYVGGQDRLKEADKIGALPGQPQQGVDFHQYAGYVTIDKKAGRALFYYFVESPQHSSTKPVVLWLNGGNEILHTPSFTMNLLLLYTDEDVSC